MTRPRPTGLPDPPVFQITLFGVPEPGDGGPRVLIEVPHGATTPTHFEVFRDRLESPLPEEIEAFFYVNTDIGAPEIAYQAGRRLARAGISSVVLRSLIPRTFADCNRALDHQPEVVGAGGVTPSIPSYVTSPTDREWLASLHRRYVEEATSLYELICGRGGVAVSLHTYAPKSVTLHRVDGAIVSALREAYAPIVYEQWPVRPPVDLITATPDGRRVADEAVALSLIRGYRDVGIEATENATYSLIPKTLGADFALRYAGRVFGLEIRRDLVGDPWIPFEPVPVSADAAQRLAAPLADALAASLLEPARA